MTTITYNHPRRPLSDVKSLLKRAGHALSAFVANYSVAMAWASGRRAHPADLEKAGFTKDFEDQILATMNNPARNSR